MEETTNLETKVEATVKVDKPIDAILDLSATRKKRICIDGDVNRVIEVNTGDLGIIQRLNNLASRIEALSSKYIDIKFDDSLEEKESTAEFEKAINSMDAEMRDMVDELFQTNVCDVCVPDGTMWDMFNGHFRYEIIVEQLINLCADTIQAETKKTMDRLHKYTNKYMPKDHMAKRK